MIRQMNAKTKLIFSLMVLLVAIGVLTITIIAVYAASNQGVGAQFNIRYTIGEHIGVRVDASYQVENDNSVDIGTITFNVKNTVNNGTMRVAEPIELTTPTTEQPTSHKYVEFTYNFTNLTNSEKVKVKADWESFATDVVALNVYVDNVKVTEFSTSSIAEGFVMDPLATKTVVIKFEVYSTSSNAKMLSNSQTGLIWRFEHYSDTSTT